jgi:hypothetical protein
MKSEMATKTLALLRDRPRAMLYRDIAAQTDITEGWLLRFVGGRVPNPKINDIETLYKFLSGKTTLGL